MRSFRPRTADRVLSNDQRKELRHRRRIPVRPSAALGLTFALRHPVEFFLDNFEVLC
jgi:hypothetical protein